MARKKPALGDVIEHHEPQFNRVRIGTVVMLLSAQFAYETEEGENCLCMYNENWKFLNKGTKK